jgi:bifunctional UDP-N-acetylglucosamine pyrophosphorylase/glucosamine-1-phosphate N-acetyltransferase
MKAIILAAGKSTRMYPLTLNKPKPLLKVANISIIKHNLGQLLDLVDEVILVVGYKADMIMNYLGDKFQDIKITYVKQEKQLGTGHALMQAKKYVTGQRFIVTMGDDLYFRGDMRRCLRYDISVMVRRVENYQDYGVFKSQGSRILDLVEKPTEYISDLANTGFYILNGKIFDILEEVKKSKRGEYELTEALKKLAVTEDIFSVESNVWLPIGYPWNLLEADQILREEEVKVGHNSVIKGKVVDCTVGRNCRIDGFVRNSVIGDNVIIHKNSVVEDSVISDNVEFSGTIETKYKTAVKVKDRVIEVDNFGAAIGDGARLIDVLIEPGSLIWPKIRKKGNKLRGIIKR